jgi:hypothetical protein
MKQLNVRIKNILTDSKKNEDLLFFLFVFLLGYIMIARYEFFADDVKWLSQEIFKNPITWMLHGAKDYQPRLVSDFLASLLHTHLMIWKIFNAFCLAISVYLTANISISKNGCKNIDNKSLRFFVAGGLFLIYPNVLSMGYYWYAGSFSYSIPYAFMLIAAMPFIKAMRGDFDRVHFQGLTIWKAILFMIISAAACYTEQKAAFLIVFCSIALVFCLLKKIKISKTLYVLYGWIFVNSTIFIIWNEFLSYRRKFEKFAFYPNFDSISIIGKIFQSVNYTNFHIIYQSFLFLTASILICYVLFKKYSDIKKYLGFIPLLYVLNVFLPFETIFSHNSSSPSLIWRNNIFYDFYKIAMPDNFSGNVIPAMITLFVIFVFGILLFFLFDDNSEKVLAVVFYGASLSLGYILGFSSTIFASGSRIFYVPDLLFLILFGMIANCFLSIASKNIKNVIMFIFSIVSILATVRICYLFFLNNIFYP